MKDSQLQMACDHLGHTPKVHGEHYRQVSTALERVQISKLLLIQDMNLTGKVRGKELEDVEITGKHRFLSLS